MSHGCRLGVPEQSPGKGCRQTGNFSSPFTIHTNIHTHGHKYYRINVLFTQFASIFKEEMHSLYFHILPLYSTLFLTLCFPLPLSLTHFSHYFSPFSSFPLTLLPVGGPLSFSHLFPHALYLSLSPFLILSFSPFSLSPLLPLLPITLCLCCLPLFQTLTLPSSPHFFLLTLSHSPFLFCSLSPVGAPLPPSMSISLCLSLTQFPSFSPFFFRVWSPVSSLFFLFLSHQ